MSETAGACELRVLQTYLGPDPVHEGLWIAFVELRAWADIHDAEDARRDARLKIAEDQWLECRDGWDDAVAVLRQAREALTPLEGTEEADAALAAIDALM